MDKWSDLPIDIMSRIIIRLEYFDNILVCSAVCKSWQLAISSLKKSPLRPKFPWLMLAQDDDKRGVKSRDDAIQTRGFFSLLDYKTYNFNLPEAVGRKYLGTSFGWLLTFGLDLQINLLHPMSKSQINLPPQHTFGRQYDDEDDPEYLRNIFVRKVALSINPWKLEANDYDPDCVIMAIYGEVSLLAFTKLGGKAWIDVPTSARGFSDIVYYKEKFYAVDSNAVVYVCDIDEDHQIPKATKIAHSPKETYGVMKKYLVESSGQLMLVQRIYEGRYYVDNKPNDDLYVTVGFVVMKLVESTRKESRYKFKWEKVDSLGDEALFFSNSSSVSLPASSFNGCKANCIYFTDDNQFNDAPQNGGGFDMGIYSMENGKIEPHYKGQSLSYFSTPLWYT